MKILKYELIKNKEGSVLDIEIDTSTSSDNYSIELVCHKNRGKPIDIKDNFVKHDNNIIKAKVDLKKEGVTNTTVILMNILVDELDNYHALVIDVENYYGCLLKEVLQLTSKTCDTTCGTKENDNLVILDAVLNAFKDAHSLGLIEDTFKIASVLDRLCNNNCNKCNDD